MEIFSVLRTVSFNIHQESSPSIMKLALLFLAFVGFSQLVSASPVEYIQLGSKTFTVPDSGRWNSRIQKEFEGFGEKRYNTGARFAEPEDDYSITPLKKHVTPVEPMEKSNSFVSQLSRKFRKIFS